MKKVSDLLRETREAKGLSLEDVERETKIKEEFLHEIEEGRFQNLPSENYAQGFVKNYAKFLGLPLATVIPIFRREYKAKQNVHIVPNFRRTQHNFNKRFFLSGRSLLIAAVLILVGVYIFFQYSSIIFAPDLKISSPKDGQVVEDNIVEIRGETDPYATVTVNKDDVYVDLTGEFKKSEYMFSGDNKITISAKNRFGKESIKIITVKVK